MRIPSRFWNVSLAVVAIAWTGIAVAQSPQPPATVPADGRLDPAQDRYLRDHDGVPTLAPRHAPEDRVTHAIAQQAAPRWVTVVGDVESAGSYELASSTISLAELLARSGGPSELSHHVIQLVRDSRTGGRLESLETPLKAGDLLVVQNLDPAVPSGSVPLGLIGLTDVPVAVRVPAEVATINGILKLARQSHLSPENVTVLVDGARNVPFDGATRLPACAVLVFDPATVHPDRLPTLPTNRFASAARDHILLANQVRDEPSNTGPRDLPQQRSNAAPAGHVSITSATPAEDDLSPLPSVQPLGPPPLDNALPRTAAASDAIAIGPPEIDSHIVPYPVEEFPSSPTEPRLAAAPNPPPHKSEPVGLPVEDADAEETASEEAAGWDLWPIVLISMLLGGGTFFVIRRFRERRPHGDSSSLPRFEALRQWKAGLAARGTDHDREPAEPAVENSPPATIPFHSRPHVPINVPAEEVTGLAPSATVATATSTDLRADLLAALVGNRLAFREEPVELPRGLFVQGRSMAPDRHRLDAGNQASGSPHIFEKPRPSPIRPTEEESDEEESRDEAIFDPAEPLSGLSLSERSGTPFEQALAKLRGSRP